MTDKPEPADDAAAAAARSEREVVELHAFLQDWLDGTAPRTAEAFERFRGVMGEGLIVISPRGSVTGRDDLLREFEASHGALAEKQGAFKIWIENFVCRRRLGGRVLVTYEEWHELDGNRSARLSTVLFGPIAETAAAPNGLAWLHVHETWLPDLAPAGGERFPED